MLSNNLHYNVRVCNYIDINIIDVHAWDHYNIYYSYYSTCGLKFESSSWSIISSMNWTSFLHNPLLTNDDKTLWWSRNIFRNTNTDIFVHWSNYIGMHFTIHSCMLYNQLSHPSFWHIFLANDLIYYHFFKYMRIRTLTYIITIIWM